ncbi:sporulation integral membrane protein YtvI [Acetanaerobacterium elongatum]|uniref:Sporulation integral membrane protein YtvI n=1 Tax=Acetanaerobacterium elongatum TaxID=258515 RepID=A0A1H0G6P5_9FIRM|nr:sporulation integral membrane protein YtvI [Acetanaerobacterium elongatum]SDO02542.1 sporulation integral membrane protein YtvI [Acetanaerobacterium elongatum]
MNIDKVERRRAFIINTLYWAIVIALIYLCLKYVAAWIMPFIIGFFIAYLLKPAVEFFHRKLKGNRKAWAVLVIIIAYGLLCLLLWLLGWRIVTGLRSLFEVLPNVYMNDIEPALQRLNDYFVNITAGLSPDITQAIQDMLGNVMNGLKDLVINVSKSVVSWVAQVSAKVPAFLLSLIFTIMSSVFILLDYPNIRSFLLKQLPSKYVGWLQDAKGFVSDTLLKYLRAYSIIMSITFVELSIGLGILRVKSFILIALIIAVVDILPVLGTGSIVVPWIIICIIQGNYGRAAGLLILYVVIIVVRNIMEPRIVGKSIGLNPLLTLMCMYIGFINFGVLGMLLIPMLLLIAINFQESGKIKFWKT